MSRCDKGLDNTALSRNGLPKHHADFSFLTGSCNTAPNQTFDDSQDSSVTLKIMDGSKSHKHENRIHLSKLSPCGDVARERDVAVRNSKIGKPKGSIELTATVGNFGGGAKQPISSPRVVHIEHSHTNMRLLGTLKEHMHAISKRMKDQEIATKR